MVAKVHQLTMPLVPVPPMVLLKLEDKPGVLLLPLLLLPPTLDPTLMSLNHLITRTGVRMTMAMGFLRRRVNLTMQCDVVSLWMHRWQSWPDNSSSSGFTFGLLVCHSLPTLPLNQPKPFALATGPVAVVETVASVKGADHSGRTS